MGSFLVDNSTENLLVHQWVEESAFEAVLHQPMKLKMPILNQEGDQFDLLFDGDDDVLTGDIEPIDLQNCNIYLVLTPNVPLTGTYVFQSFYHNENLNNLLFLSFGAVDGKPTIWFGDGENNESLSVDYNIVNNEKQIWGFKSDGDTKEFYINNTLVASTSLTLSSIVNKMRLGGGNESHYANCSIMGTPIYDIPKNEAQQSSILNFLSSRYGTNLSLDFIPPTVGGDGILTITEVTDSSVSLAWQPATDNMTDAENLHYVLREGDEQALSDLETFDDERLVASGTNLLEATDNEAGPGIEYFYAVKVTDEQGNSALYAVVSELTDNPDVGFFEVELQGGGLEFEGDPGDQAIIEWEISTNDGATSDVTVESQNTDVVTVESVNQSTQQAVIEIQGAGEVDNAIVRVFPSFYETWANTPSQYRFEIDVARYLYEDEEELVSETWTFETE